MATLREAIPDYKTNGIFKNIPGISSWGMSPELLDITLMGKYGNKTINSLMKEFTNNQGVVQDMSGLTNLVWQFHQDNWMKLYDAMRQDYNPIKPYSKDINQTVEDNNTRTEDLSSTLTNNLNKSNTGTQSESGTITDDIDSTKTSTLSGNDATAKTGSDTATRGYNNYNERITEKYDERTQRSFSGSIEDAKQGTESVRNYTSDYYIPDGSSETPSTLMNRNVTESYGDNNITPPDGSAMPDDIGVRHAITKDNSQSIQASTSEAVNAANPYDEQASLGNVEISEVSDYPSTDEDNPKADETTTNTTFKPTDKQQQANNQINKSGHTLEESTVDKSTTHNKDVIKKDEHTDTSYPTRDPRKDVRTFNNYQETESHTTPAGSFNEKEKGITGEIEDETAYGSTETTTYGKVDTFVEDGTNERTISNTRTDNLTEALTGTATTVGDNTVTDAGTHEMQSSATGNLGFMTSQRQLEEEINLRQKYFYDGVVKDVAKLLTVGTYA